jgi:NAD(P)-dependent dehydrogenase (short-subunit alcohol dehydrogenase family)
MDADQDLFKVRGKVALISGGGSGIGLGAALELAKQGAQIGLLDQTEEDLTEALQELRALGAEVEPLVADVSRPEEVKAAVEQLVERMGRIDMVFANAGINGLWAAIEQLEPEDWDKTLNVNLKGSFLLIKYATPYLKRQGGSVLITSSINGTRTFSNSGATAYSVSKAGQIALCKMLAVELGQNDIRVNCICPGSIETNIHENTERRGPNVRWPAHYPEGSSPLRGKAPGSKEQVGRLALFLLSDMSSHISGEVVYIDAAQSLIV